AVVRGIFREGQMVAFGGRVSGGDLPLMAEVRFQEQVPLLRAAVEIVMTVEAGILRAAIERGQFRVGAGALYDAVHLVVRRDRDSARIGSVYIAQRVTGERIGPVERGPVEVTGVGGEIAEAVSTAQHKALQELVAEAHTRPEVAIMRVPHI